MLGSRFPAKESVASEALWTDARDKRPLNGIRRGRFGSNQGSSWICSIAERTDFGNCQRVRMAFRKSPSQRNITRALWREVHRSFASDPKIDNRGHRFHFIEIGAIAADLVEQIVDFSAIVTG
jgi:hypothetical protein